MLLRRARLVVGRRRVGPPPIRSVLRIAMTTHHGFVKNPGMLSDLDRVASATHTDPHVFLGPHEVDGGLVVRVIRPNARGAVVVTDFGDRHAMRRIHDAGIFEVFVPDLKLPLRYQVEVSYDTATYTLHDPYAFPRSSATSTSI